MTDRAEGIAMAEEMLVSLAVRSDGLAAEGSEFDIEQARLVLREALSKDPADLQPLYVYMIQSGVKDRPIHEIMLSLYSRHEYLQIPIVLPLATSKITRENRQAIINDFEMRCPIVTGEIPIYGFRKEPDKPLPMPRTNEVKRPKPKRSPKAALIVLGVAIAAGGFYHLILPGLLEDKQPAAPIALPDMPCSMEQVGQGVVCKVEEGKAAPSKKEVEVFTREALKQGIAPIIIDGSGNLVLPDLGTIEMPEAAPPAP
jgi:hypothetical protein